MCNISRAVFFQHYYRHVYVAAAAAARAKRILIQADMMRFVGQKMKETSETSENKNLKKKNDSSESQLDRNREKQEIIQTSLPSQMRV